MAYNAVTTSFSKYATETWGMEGGGFAGALMVATVAVFLMALKGKLKKSDGVIMILMYAAYLAYLIIRTLLAKA